MEAVLNRHALGQILRKCTCPKCGHPTWVLQTPQNRKLPCSASCRMELGLICKKTFKKPRSAITRTRSPEERMYRKAEKSQWENAEMELIRESWR